MKHIVFFLLLILPFSTPLEGQNKKEDIDNPADYKSWYNRGRSYHNTRKYRMAIEYYGKAIEIDAGDADVWYARGLSFYRLDNFNNAIINFDQAIKLKPEYADAHFFKAFSYVRLEQYETALVNYDAVIRIDSTHSAGWNNKGYAHELLEDYDTALDCYNRAISLMGDDILYWSNKGRVLTKMKRYPEALISLERAMEIDSNNYPQNWYYLGETLFNLDRQNEAVAGYNKAVEIDALYQDALYKKAYSQRLLGDDIDALDGYYKLVKMNPRDAVAWDNLSSLLIDLDMYAEAQMGVTTSLELNSESLHAQYLQARIYEETKKYDKAIQTYRRIEDRNKNFNNLAFRMADTYCKMKRVEMAEDYVNRALVQDPNHAHAWWLKGRISSQNGASEEALTCLERASGLSSDSKIWLDLSQEYLRQRHYSKAKESLRILLKLDSKNEEAKELLAKIINN